MRNVSRASLPLAAAGLVLALAACSVGPPPRQIADARAALEDARLAEAEQLAARPFDAAVRYLAAAENTWEDRHDEDDAAHWARLAEGAARQAQYEAEATRAEEAVRRESERRRLAELAVRDAEIASLQAEARSEAELRAREAEIRAREEERQRLEEAERRAAAASEAEREAAARAAAEQRAIEAETRAEAERLAGEDARRQMEERAAEERRRLEEEQRRIEEERLQAEANRQAEIARLQEEQERTREELRATLSRLAEVREEARGLIVTLPGSIYFEVNKAVIQPGMRSRLGEIGRALAAVPDQAVLIEGHTDADGTNEYNLELSRLRAEAVRSVLVGAGVEPGRVETQGYGETRPVASNASSSGKAQNRRVELVLQGAGR